MRTAAAPQLVGLGTPMVEPPHHQHNHQHKTVSDKDQTLYYTSGLRSFEITIQLLNDANEIQEDLRKLDLDKIDHMEELMFYISSTE